MMRVPEVSLIVRVDLGAHGRLGPGKIMLLEKINELGSISAAGRAMNMSYRQAWELVDQLNKAFAEPVASSQTGGKSGGGAVLTAFGHELVKRYTQIAAHAAKVAASDIAAIQGSLRPAAEVPPV